MEFDALSNKVIGCALEVHRQLGPGLLESAYEACLAYELEQGGLAFKRQYPLPVQYKSVSLDCVYRADMVVEGQVIVELKSVERMLALHEAQLLSYMKLAGVPIGLLINFNVSLLRDGIKRMVL
jgi:GxxExxY protein